MSRGAILVVDDEADICRIVEEILTDENYDVSTALNAQAARAAYNEQIGRASCRERVCT